MDLAPTIDERALRDECRAWLQANLPWEYGVGLPPRFLPRILAADEIWCQLFSEPGAGSDLASLSTRATRVDGGWLLNGQKVWTSYAQFADFGACLTRSDPDAKPQAGISYCIVDMR